MHALFAAFSGALKGAQGKLIARVVSPPVACAAHAEELAGSAATGKSGLRRCAGGPGGP